MSRATHEKQLRIISRAWGRKQDGYAFLPWIDREEQARAGIRRAGFHESRAFHWPEEREAMVEHMASHTQHDLYWCPSLFESSARVTEQAMDEHALWADLDEADPTKISDYPPTVAWETSPGRYQALWLLSQGDLQGASWPGKENQRLTYHIGADPSGWDTTQLLRIPGWTNHKLEYRDANGKYPEGRLLWSSGRTYLPDEFVDLPVVESPLSTSEITEAIIGEIDATDRTKVIARVKLKLTKLTRDQIRAKEAGGDRSDTLWQIERSLADAGCTVAEIVAVVKATVWNKYEGRADEYKRLITEATKAITARPTEVEEKLEEELEPKPDLGRIADVLANVKPPKWLIRNILTEGGVGFIAGEPKANKSWVGFDMAISVATGTRFLNYFDVVRPSPVLFIEEEDPGTTLKSRQGDIWKSKNADSMSLDRATNSVIWAPPEVQEGVFDPDIALYLQKGVTLSEGHWQEWLADTLRRGMPLRDGTHTPFGLMLIDTLMMTAGDVEENRAQEMTTKLFKPMKQIAREFECALLFIHHMRKGSKDENRGGQRLLGSVANHAWAEDSIYLQPLKTGVVHLQTESKSVPGHEYRIDGLKIKGWHPVVSSRDAGDEPEPIDEERPARSTDPVIRAAMDKRAKRQAKVDQLSESDQDLIRLLDESPAGMTMREITSALIGPESGVGFMHNRVKRLQGRGLVNCTAGRPAKWFKT
jgi:hypothetical protein